MAWPGRGSDRLQTPVCLLSTHESPLEGLNKNNSVAAREFDISLNRVNWLGNIMACTYIPAAALTPWLVSRYGVRRAVRRSQPFRLMILDSYFDTVRSWCRLLNSRRLDSVRWHCKLTIWQQRLRSPHLRSGASRDSHAPWGQDNS